MERYDIAVVGSGPAGISAAITAKARNKTVLLLGDRALSKKIRAAQMIYNYPGLPEVTGEELADAFAAHLAKAGLSVTQDRIGAVYAMGRYFALQGGVEQYEAKSLILACGVSAERTLDGEKEFWGRGVSYCATCDAMFYKGKTVAVVGDSEKEEKEAAFLAEVAQRVLYFPMYPYRKEGGLPEAVEVIRETPVGLEGGKKAERLVTKEGSHEADGFFILRESVGISQLLPGVRTQDRHVAVNRRMETNIRGCFACGDITGAPYQYIKAAGEGNVAALSAVAYLADLAAQK